MSSYQVPVSLQTARGVPWSGLCCLQVCWSLDAQNSEEYHTTRLTLLEALNVVVRAAHLLAQGYLSVNYSDNYFFLSQRHPEVPRLTSEQLAAMKLFNQLAASDELRLEASLQPGDIQLLSNHTQVDSLSPDPDACPKPCTLAGLRSDPLLSLRFSSPLP